MNPIAVHTGQRLPRPAAAIGRNARASSHRARVASTALRNVGTASWTSARAGSVAMLKIQLGTYAAGIANSEANRTTNAALGLQEAARAGMMTRHPSANRWMMVAPTVTASIRTEGTRPGMKPAPSTRPSLKLCRPRNTTAVATIRFGSVRMNDASRRSHAIPAPTTRPTEGSTVARAGSNRSAAWFRRTAVIAWDKPRNATIPARSPQTASRRLAIRPAKEYRRIAESGMSPNPAARTERSVNALPHRARFAARTART